MPESNRQQEALPDYIEARRQLKAAWDAFHRQAYRQTFIHARLALEHLSRAAVILEGADPGADVLDQFFSGPGKGMPLDKAEGFTAVMQAPELKPLGPVSRGNISDSVDDWFVTRKISRGRAFEFLTQAQESANLAITLIEKRHAHFFRLLN